MLDRLCYTYNMPKRKRSEDVNLIASRITEESTRSLAEGKNPAAVALGHLGGLKGGKARAKKLSSMKRKEIASKAAKTRWEKWRRENG
jgi:hypothetical protein